MKGSSINNLKTVTVSALRELAGEQPIRMRTSGGSMAPLLEHGAAVEVAASRWYWPGDVIVFRSRDGRFLVHRVIGYRIKSFKLEIVAQADNASVSVNDVPVHSTQVIGKLCGGDGSPLLASVPLSHRLHSLYRFSRLVCHRLAAKLQ